MHTLISTKRVEGTQEFIEEHRVTFDADQINPYVLNDFAKRSIEELKDDLANTYWHRQKDEDIFDAIQGWDIHNFLILTPDGKYIKATGIRDEAGDGSISTYLTNSDTDEDIWRKDVEFWIKLPPNPVYTEVKFGDKLIQKCRFSK